MLISSGERVSMALLAMALEERSVPAISLTGSQSGIITCSFHSEALIEEVRPVRILQHLSEGKVVIVAGFQGVSRTKEVTTLGRGGGDTSAVALGVSLGASHVEFYKDVKGVYAMDPKKWPSAELFSQLSYEKALMLPDSVLHKRAIALAMKNQIPLHVLSFLEENRSAFPGTWIGSFAERGAPQYETRERAVGG